MKTKRVILYILSFIVPLVLCAGALCHAGAVYRKNTNLQMAVLAGNIKARYPDIGEAEMLHMLQDTANREEGQAFLRKYGVYGGAFAGETQQKFAAAAFIWLFACGAGVFLCCGVVTVFFARKRDRALNGLTAYLKQIGNGNDTLRIDENDEGELSKLKNEIYKLTVLLRETAAAGSRKSAALARSIADISHQIRTPLTSAGILLDNVAGTPEMDPATRADFINEARGRLRLISELCVTLLQLSKFDAGAIRLHPAEITPRQILKAAVENLSVLMDLKNITPELTGDLDIPFTADLHWQTEAFTNILKNAVEHSPENSVVRISAQNSGLFLSIRVADAGEGIDSADLPHIFERFYKAKNAGPDSFGVGLNLAKTVIEADGGSIKAVSWPGKGTTFTVAYRRTV